jgi:phosphoglycolate phosphatase
LKVVGAGYEAADVDPERYSARVGTSVKRLDLCQDTSKLPSEHYDLVLHNHVLEHVPCNYTWVAQNLHRAVKRGGAHVFSIPISAGYYAEDLDPKLTTDERSARFGQHDHMRRFGRNDFSASFGNLFGMRDPYSLTDFFSEDVLIASNIRKSQWTCSGSSVFYIRKAAGISAH